MLKTLFKTYFGPHFAYKVYLLQESRHPDVCLIYVCIMSLCVFSFAFRYTFTLAVILCYGAVLVPVCFVCGMI